MRSSKWFLTLLLACLFALVLAGGASPYRVQAQSSGPHAPLAPRYVIVSSNDLGMHCYNRDFRDLAVLPPYNTIWAQVVQVDDPPKIVTSGITLSYSFPDNTYSYKSANGAIKKSNFWDYAQQLFGVALPPDIGLTGKGLSGTMDLTDGDHFEAKGIPLTEYRDQDVSGPDPMQWPRYPYQKAQIVARDATTQQILAEQTVVAPVSTEMHCEWCHSDGQREGITTGRVETNILTLHDQEEHTNLMASRPVLCASCHSSNALGTPGRPDARSLSNAMHHKHMDDDVNLPNNTGGCYACHPGPQTQCLRDVMSQRFGFQCQNCHGPLSQVATNPDPWLNEPRCDSTNCHGSNVAQNNPLYRMSTGHGGVRCEGCHDSTHAIAKSGQANDAIKFINLQGHTGTLNSCGACHLTPMTGRIHPTAMVLPPRGYLPLVTHR